MCESYQDKMRQSADGRSVIEGEVEEADDAVYFLKCVEVHTHTYRLSPALCNSFFSHFCSLCNDFSASLSDFFSKLLCLILSLGQFSNQIH